MKAVYPIIAVLALVPTSAAHAQAIPECQARVVHGFTDDQGGRWAAGKLIPSDIVRHENGRESYCAHGGGCFARTIDGHEVLRLTNCRQGSAIGGGDYRLIPDPRLMGAAAARRFDRHDQAAARLNDLGFSNASAATYANTYVLAPRSADGRLVARALAGSKTALAAMRAKSP